MHDVTVQSIRIQTASEDADSFSVQRCTYGLLAGPLEAPEQLPGGD